MTIQHAHSRALSRPARRLRRPLLAAGAAALALPLVLQGTVAHAESFAPIDAVEALANGTTLPDFQQEFLAAVNSQNIWNHDVHLADTIGPRVAGTAGEEAAAVYVENTLESYGFDTSREFFAATPQTFADVTPSRTQAGYASWQFKPASNAVFTGPDAPVSGDLVDIGNTVSGLDTRTDLVGKFVLADWNGTVGTRTTLLKALASAGASGVVFTKVSGMSSPEALPNPGAVPAEAQDLVVVGAALNQGNRMRALLAEGPLSLSITTQTGTDKSTNVIGVREAANGDPNAPIVYIGAHIDSVVGSHGASDNGSGASIMLELARILSSYSLDTEVRVGAWGAEEQGIKGSKHHAADVMTQDERDRTIGAWNMDMAGTNYEGNPGQPFGFWALTVDGAEKEDNPVLWLANIVSGLAGKGDLKIGQVGRSDHQSFHDVGIPAVVFSWMYWAGGTNIVLEPAYHQTTDTLEFVSEERMALAAQILGGSVFRASLEEVTVKVTDETGTPAEAASVALSCEGDTGWRDSGDTGATGALTTHTPAATCDFVAVGADGSRGAAKAVQVAGDPTVKIQLQSDAEAPVANIDAGAGSATGWHVTAPVTVTVSAIDDADDAPALEFSLDGTAWAPYVAPVELGEDGRHTVHARATDDFGNVSDVVQQRVDLDTVAPVLQASAATKRGTIDLTAQDATSGVAQIEFRIGETAAWQPLVRGADLVAGAATAEVALGAAATTVQLRAVDVAGNTGEVTFVQFAEGAPTKVEPVKPVKPVDPVDPVDPPKPGSASGGAAAHGAKAKTLPTTGGAPLIGVGVAAGTLIIAGGLVLALRRRRLS